MKRKITILLLLIGLSACTAPFKSWNPSDYTVRSGDTLYSIAWRYEINPDDLVRWNRLHSGALIYPGQRLHTRKPTGFDAKPHVEKDNPDAEFVEVESAPVPVRRPEEKTTTVKKGQTLYSLARSHGKKTSEIIAWNGLKKPYTIYPGQKLRLQPPPKPVITKKPPVKKQRTRLTWDWPVRGNIIKGFNSKKLDAKGIDIAAPQGKPVLAAAPGKVVYSGNGLISYGNLVIIKHNSTYLSAYANNDSLLVKEGQVVKQGQAIAKLGKSASKTPYLHFEIRKKGKPVDPRKYLPSS